MSKYEYTSCVAGQIEAFVRSRRAADAMSDGAQKSLRLFDAYVSRAHPDADGLTQEMVDGWCRKRDTETPSSCLTRTQQAVNLVRFLRSRGETEVEEPERPRPSRSTYVPHDFTDDELRDFFGECDAWTPGPACPKEVAERNARTFPVLYRLLLSTGIRTCEARLLARASVDLGAGVLRIVAGKGRSERIVALHPSMLELAREYDEAMEALLPGRAFFFPNGRDGHLTSNWVSLWFRRFWSRVSDVRATPYMLRHAYATRTINRLVGKGLGGLADLQWVSKALGHTSVDVTVGTYYHIVPALASCLQDRSEAGFDDVVPEA